MSYNNSYSYGIQDGNEDKPLLKGDNVLVDAEKVSQQTNEWQTFVNITKSIVGAGSFGLPYCFMNMGVAGAILTVVVMGLCSVYTTLMLLRNKKQIEEKHSLVDTTYVDVAKYTYGQVLAVIVYLLLVLASLGVGASYIVFIGTQMNLVYPGFSQLEWKALTLIGVVPLALLRSFKNLAFTSLFGTISLCAALIVTTVYGFTYNLEEFKTFVPPAFSADYFHSFGSVAFLFCIQFLIIPIERAMAQPDTIWRPMTLSVTSISFFNIIFGVFGFMFFGEGTCGSILSNLDDESSAAVVLAQVVRVTVCVDLLFTYPLVVAPGREIVENFLVQDDAKWKETKKNVIRLLLVMVTFAMAQIEKFSVITNLVGIPMSVLAFVIPPLMDIKINGFENLKPAEKVIYVLLIVGGLGASIVTTVYGFGITPPGEC